MAILPILTFPDPRLHTKAKPIAVVDERIKKLADDMAETMYKAPGIGLAATQVNVHERLLVTDVSEERNDLRVLINPKIIRAENFVKNQEGCLSVPGIYDDVERAQSITVEALDRNGEAIQFDAEGLLAVCIQHEMDHLDGKVFVEYLSMFKQSRIKTKMKKRARELEQE
jgi:peptide deformylase